MQSVTTVFTGDESVLPPQVKAAHFNVDAGIELKIKVSERNGVQRYGFAYDGVAVPMRNGAGTFFATKDKEALLEWVMEGLPGGTMKVSVTRNGTAVKERDKSTIPAPYARGYDAFKLKVS